MKSQDMAEQHGVNSSSVNTVPTNSIRAVIGNTPVTIEVDRCDHTLLDWWRGNQQLTGTKEGCAEGDCGACTLILGEVIDGRVRYRPVNSCIMPLPMIHGKHVVSVEHLANQGDNPVQTLFAKHHASQCGFCTPGFVMSLYCAWLNAMPNTRETINDVFAGNLCRCTGYGPIIAAAQEVLQLRRDDSHSWREAQQQVIAWSKNQVPIGLSPPQDSVYHATQWHAPVTLGALLELRQQHPQSVIIAGGTDVGLWLTKGLQEIECFIHTGMVQELQRIEWIDGELHIGAAVSYLDAEADLAKSSPAFTPLLRRIASRQIRATGTIGGNIANGSPIGDMPPALIVLNSRLVLRSVIGSREVPLEDFFLQYGQQDIVGDEVLEKVIIPPVERNNRVAFYKVSKRFDQDISAVLGAFCIAVDGGTVSNARIAFGGMAGVPQRATATEQALQAQPWNQETIDNARASIAKDFTPMTDMRASDTYRLEVAANLLQRFYDRDTGQPIAIEQLSVSHVG